MWALLLGLGPRIGEVLALRMEDLDLSAGFLRIERTLTMHGSPNEVVNEPKTPGSRRTLYLPGDLSGALGAWLERRRTDRENASEGWNELSWLFCAENGSRLNYSNVRREFKHLCQVVGVTDLKVHDLRRTFATLAVRSGVSPDVVARILGHVSVTLTLNIYRQVQDEDLRRAAPGLADLFGR